MENAEIVNGLKSTENNGKRFSDSQNPTTNVKLIGKLPSIGPLDISDLSEFLVKAKIDFEKLYRDKTIADLKIVDFEIIRTLGSGAFGKVILAKLIKDKELYAIKAINKKSIIKGKHFQYVHNEKRVLQSINFPFVVYLKYFFLDYNYLYFVMPFVPGGEFFDYVQNYKPLNESTAKFYISQLVLALEYLHYLGLIHRDVKPENIMLDATGYLKLVDFGQCIRVYDNDRAFTFTGTPEYMAPEIIKSVGYDCAVDWWALGVTLYEICAGYRPFKSSNKNRLYKLIEEGKYEIPSFFSNHLTALIKMLFLHVPDQRIANYENGARQIKKHIWFKDTNWLAILNRTLQAPYIPKILE